MGVLRRQMWKATLVYTAGVGWASGHKLSGFNMTLQRLLAGSQNKTVRKLWDGAFYSHSLSCSQAAHTLGHSHTSWLGEKARTYTGMSVWRNITSNAKAFFIFMQQVCFRMWNIANSSFGLNRNTGAVNCMVIVEDYWGVWMSLPFLAWKVRQAKTNPLEVNLPTHCLFI